MPGSIIERDALIDNLLDRQEQLEERVRILEATHPGLAGTFADTLAYYDADGDQVTANDVRVAGGLSVGDTSEDPDDDCVHIADGGYIRSDMEAMVRNISVFQGLPGLRGFWPLSNFLSTGNVIDMSDRDYDLIRVGNPLYKREGMLGYMTFDGAGDYCYKADAGAPDLDITGSETYIHSASRGLTLGGWFRPGSLAAAQALISKLYTANQYAYELNLRGDVAGDPISFTISDDGANTDDVQGATATVDEWQWFAARFDNAETGEELAVWRNASKTTAATAMAAIFNGTDRFAIGGRGNGTLYYTGDQSRIWLCCMALPDAQILAAYQLTRDLYGV